MLPVTVEFRVCRRFFLLELWQAGRTRQVGLIVKLTFQNSTHFLLLSKLCFEPIDDLVLLPSHRLTHLELLQ